MFQLLQYYGKWQGFRGRMAALPAWARFLVGIAALPGILLILLSILAFLVSLLALFLLTTPVYRVVTALAGDRSTGGDDEIGLVPDGYGGFGPPPEGMDVIIDQPGSPAADDDRGQQGGDDARPSVTVVEAPGEVASRPRRQIDVKIVE